MAQTSAIQWTDFTWNWARGCTKVDEDCKFCYMYRDSFDSHRYNPLEVVRTKTVFDLPLRYKKTVSEVRNGKPLCFVSSLTDWAHPAIDSYRHEAYEIIQKCSHIYFQMLTKRPERLPEILPKDWGKGWDNVWLGTSVGSNKNAHRIYELCQVPAKCRFLSIEPLWEEVDIQHNYFYRNFGKVCSSCSGKGYYSDNFKTPCPDCERTGINPNPIHWVIVGGESGNENGKYGYRPCKLEWIESIVKQCQDAGVPVFVKQLGTHLAKQMKLKDRHGGDWNEWPEHLRIRQFPKINVPEEEPTAAEYFTP